MGRILVFIYDTECIPGESDADRIGAAGGQRRACDGIKRAVGVDVEHGNGI